MKELGILEKNSFFMRIPTRLPVLNVKIWPMHYVWTASRSNNVLVVQLLRHYYTKTFIILLVLQY